MRGTTRRLLSLVAPHRGVMLLGAIFGFLTIGASVGLLMLSAYIISAAALHPSIALLQVPIVGVRFFGIARGFMRYLERLFSHRVTFRILGDLRVHFYEKLEPLAPAGLQGYHSGELFSRILSDIDRLESFYIRTISPPIVAMMVGGLMFALLYPLAPLAAFVHLAFYVSSGLVIPWLTHRLARPHARRLGELSGQLHSVIIDGLRGMADLRVYGMTERHLEDVGALSRELETIHHRGSWLKGLHAALMDAAMFMAVAMTLGSLLPLVEDGAMRGVYLAVVALGIMASYEALVPLPQAFLEIESTLHAAERLFELVDVQSDNLGGDEGIAPSGDDEASLRLDGISYRYPAMKEKVLDRVSLTLDHGKKIAIVGASGSGKSTLLELVVGLRRPVEGTIHYGARTYDDISRDALRRRFAVVSVRSHLFHETLRENMRLAKPDADDEEIMAALRLAGLGDVVERLHEGLDTWVGESGERLSGGERQRLVIARAILQDAPVMVLDEPTANLDIVTEREILDVVEKVTERRALLWFTHRLVRMDRMDEILVLEEGKIVQRGRHEELRHLQGAYRDLWESQENVLALRHVPKDRPEG